MDGAEAIALERAQEGDREAFRVLVDRYSHEMFRLAYRLTGNEQDAEDVVQETFLRAFRRIDRYDARNRVSSWLYAIATNYAIDLLRRRKRWRTTEVEPTEQQGPLLSAAPGPEQAAFGGQIGARVAEAMDDLSPRERIAFTLRHHEGLSINEIGRVMGLGTSATKNHIFRAVRKLRVRLQPLMGARG